VKENETLDTRHQKTIVIHNGRQKVSAIHNLRRCPLLLSDLRDRFPARKTGAQNGPSGKCCIFLMNTTAEVLDLCLL